MKKTILFSLLILLAVACGKDPIVYPILLKLDTTAVPKWEFGVITAAGTYSSIQPIWGGKELEEDTPEIISDFLEDGSAFNQFTLTSENKIKFKILDEEVELDYKDNGTSLDVVLENEIFFTLDVNSEKDKATMNILLIGYKKAGDKLVKPSYLFYTTPGNSSAAISTFIATQKLTKNDTIGFFLPTYNYKKF